MSLITDRLLTGPYYGLSEEHFFLIPVNRSLLPDNFEFMPDIAKIRFLLEFSALQWILMGQTQIYRFDGDQESELTKVDLQALLRHKINTWREKRFENYGEDTIALPVHRLIYEAYRDLREKGHGDFCERNLVQSFYLLEHEYREMPELLFEVGEVEDYEGDLDGIPVVVPLGVILRDVIDTNHGKGALYELRDPPII